MAKQTINWPCSRSEVLEAIQAQGQEQVRDEAVTMEDIRHAVSDIQEARRQDYATYTTWEEKHPAPIADHSLVKVLWSNFKTFMHWSEIKQHFKH
ncbi:hypothetical protein [Desulfurispora thermophila]|uniref:hypothetical protein n=1 Tax=Desulfurispora thermophila TaxID=265470 RepID=UPI000367556E|nr:hypothetical protein [Desulfurispora thermophila]